MNMPLLPHPVHHIVSQGVIVGYFFNAAQMQAYGQVCRAAALEEAASLCDGEKWHDSGKPVKYIEAFNAGCTDCEAVIRRLK